MFERWFSEQQQWRLPRNQAVKNWLLWRRSMTVRMQQYVNTAITVKIISQKWQKPNFIECRLLNIAKHQGCLIREVELYTADNMIMYARSVLPKGELTERYRILPKLKHKTIGQWFFRNPKLQRSEFMLQRLSSIDALYQKTVATLNITPEFLWARRSLFSTPKQKLLLTEVFTPDLLQC